MALPAIAAAVGSKIAQPVLNRAGNELGNKIFGDPDKKADDRARAFKNDFSYQWEVEQLKKAGLSPALMYGGAGSSGGSMMGGRAGAGETGGTDMIDDYSNIVGSSLRKEQKRESKKRQEYIDGQIEQLGYQNEEIEAQADRHKAQAQKFREEALTEEFNRKNTHPKGRTRDSAVVNEARNIVDSVPEVANTLKILTAIPRGVGYGVGSIVGGIGKFHRNVKREYYEKQKNQNKRR